MDRDKIDMRNEQTWLIKDLLHGKKYSVFLVGTPRVIPNRQDNFIVCAAEPAKYKYEALVD